MSGNNGFAITKLCARGVGKLDATVSFRRGANVISGASNTGKSYILACIEYMLGRKTPPESVPEDAGYDTLYLEISSFDGRVFTFQRSLKQGGDFLVYEQPFAELDEQAEGTAYGAKAKKNDENTIPSLLLY